MSDINKLIDKMDRGQISMSDINRLIYRINNCISDSNTKDKINALEELQRLVQYEIDKLEMGGTDYE